MPRTKQRVPAKRHEAVHMTERSMGAQQQEARAGTCEVQGDQEKGVE